MIRSSARARLRSEDRGGAARRIAPLAAVITTVALLTGCTSAAPPTASATGATATAGSNPSTASPTPTAATPVTSAPAPAATTTATSAPSPVSSQRGGGKGCSPNGVRIPDGADTASIDDVDETDSGATEFYSETPVFEFGVHTKSGATIVLRDDLAGPAMHNGWMARFATNIFAVTDDGRGATLHAFVDCRFVQPEGVDGRPYSFTLNGRGTAGTGVGCSSFVDGTKKLVGLNAVRLSNGRFRIDSTEVKVSADGRRATNGPVERGRTTYAADSEAVRQANRSTCSDVPIVHTSGR